MSTNLVVNGTSYAYPATGDQNWGTAASAWAAAVTSGMLQKAGGSFTLTADVNFGTSFGLIAQYLTSANANSASAGIVRLANADTIKWRNAANNADLALTVNASNQLTYNGVVLSSTTGALFADNAFNIYNSSDSTKKLALTLAGITTGNTRTWTVPDSDLTVVGIATTQTLTNKSIDAGQLTGTIAAGRMPALTGDVTSSAGAVATSLVATTNGTLTTLSALTTASALATIGTITSGTWSATTIAVNKGGTGLTSGTSGGVLAYTASGTLASSGALTANQLVIGGGAGVAPSSLAAGSQYQSLTMGASNPGYSAVNLAQSAAVTGSLPVGNGGTGIASGTSGGVPYYSGSTTIASSGALTASQLVLGGGAGAAPTSLAAGSQYQSLVMGASNPAYGAVPLNQAAAISGTLPTGSGGTGVTSVTTSPTASAFAGWDANKNLSANNHINGYATTATAAGTTTLVVGDAGIQYFTGSTTQTVKLPVTSTLVLGQVYSISNLSSGVVTVQSSGSNTLQAMAANTMLVATVISTSGTGTASWNWSYQAIQNSLAGGGSVTSVAMTVPTGFAISGSPVTTSGTLAITLSNETANTIFAGPTSGGAAAPTFRAMVAADVVTAVFTAPTVQKFTSGTGATYTTPTSPRSPLYIRVRMIGGGGGGAGSGSASSSSNGAAGGNTTFGANSTQGNGVNMQANGGAGAVWSGGVGGVGGTTNLGSGPLGIGTGVQGSQGAGGQYDNGVASDVPGGNGAPGLWGSGAGSSSYGGDGVAGIANTGAGGGGGGTNAVTTSYAGPGGGAGGYVDVIIASPAATYNYWIGASGAGGSAGTSGKAGGAGGSGYIEVTEYYQ